MSGTENTLPRNIVARCLGALWILDGLLQFQPQMFGRSFVKQVLAPNLAGQPQAIHAAVLFGIQLWSLHPLLFDVIAGVLQIAVGALLLSPLSGASFKAGAWISIAWGSIVWLCGEGAGQLLTGTATFYSGAPGAVPFYVLLAILLLMAHRVPVGRYPEVAAATCIGGALLQLQPMFWSSGGIAASLTASTTEPFGVLRAAPAHIGHLLSLDPLAGNAVLVSLPLLVGLAVLFKPNRVTGGAAIAFLFLVWWWGQDFGMLTTLIAGTATDPDTAPLLALFVLPLFVAPRPLSRRLARSGGRELRPAGAAGKTVPVSRTAPS